MDLRRCTVRPMHMFGHIGEIKSNVPRGGDYLFTTEPPPNCTQLVVEMYRKTVAQLREWTVEVVEVRAPEPSGPAVQEDAEGAPPGRRSKT